MPAGIWPAAYDGTYLFADYVCGKIFQLAPASGGGYTATEFASGLGVGSAISLAFGKPNDRTTPNAAGATTAPKNSAAPNHAANKANRVRLRMTQILSNQTHQSQRAT